MDDGTEAASGFKACALTSSDSDQGGGSAAVDEGPVGLVVGVLDGLIPKIFAPISVNKVLQK